MANLTPLEKLRLCKELKQAYEQLEIVQVMNFRSQNERNVTIANVKTKIRQLRLELNNWQLPPMELSVGVNRKELGEVLHKWLIDNLNGIVITTSDGKRVKFNRDYSIKHLTYDGRRTEIAAKSVTKVLEVFRTGRFVARESLYKVRNDGLIAFHVYEKPVIIDGNKILLRFKAGEYNTGELMVEPDLIAYTFKAVFDSLK